MEHKMLQEPPDKGNFLTTTLRRYNRARLEKLKKAREEKDFEKIFKASFWSYSKSMLKQPLTVLEGETGGELDTMALTLFYTVQQHAGKWSVCVCVCACVCVCVCACGVCEECVISQCACTCRHYAIIGVRVRGGGPRRLCHDGAALSSEMS